MDIFKGSSSLNIRQTNTGQINFNCPFCVSRGKDTPDTGNHLYVSKTNFKYFCHRCQAAGNIIESYPTFAYYLDEFQTDILEFKERSQQIIFDLNKISEPIEDWDTEFLYLSFRHLNKEAIAHFNIRKGLDRYKWSIIIPTFIGNDCNYFISRSTRKDASIRYQNPVVAQRTGILLNYYNAVKYDSVYLTEGFFTGYAIAEGGDYFVCKLGTYVSEAQAIKLARFRQVFYCPDSDVPFQLIKKNFKIILKYCEEAYWVPIRKDKSKLDADSVGPEIRNLMRGLTIRITELNINSLEKIYQENLRKFLEI